MSKYLKYFLDNYNDDQEIKIIGLKFWHRANNFERMGKSITSTPKTKLTSTEYELRT